MNEIQNRQKILILGGTGYVGSKLQKKLSSAFEVECLGINSFNEYRFKKADILINLAAHSSVALCELFPKTAEYNNVIRLSKILENLPNETHLIHASSASVYGRGKEESDEEDLLPTPQNLYDSTKIEGDKIIRHAINAGMKATSLRFGTVCGLSPVTRVDLVLNSMVKSGISNQKISIFSPETRRSILFIDDLAEAIARICLEKPVGIYNLGSINTTVGELGRAVQESLGLESGENQLNSKSPYDFHLNCNKIESIIGNFRISSLERTIKELEKGLEDAEQTRADLQGPHPMLSMQFS
jgi:nucleoside-diphosphate-sugar epimerase